MAEITYNPTLVANCVATWADVDIDGADYPI